MDKESETDMKFILEDSKGQTIHSTKMIKNMDKNTAHAFPTFKLETDRLTKYKLKMIDEDHGMFNADDKMGEFQIAFPTEGQGSWFAIHKKNPTSMKFDRSPGKPFQMRIDTELVPVCNNGGTCQDTSNSWECICTAGWDGRRCENDIDECLARAGECGANGDCTNTPGSFECTCHPGWQGEVCDQDIDECSSPDHDVCSLENQFCVNSVGSYDCLCGGGYTGEYCQQDYNECEELRPCDGLAGSVCVSNGMNSFTCECPEQGCNIAKNHPELVNGVDDDDLIDIPDVGGVTTDSNFGEAATTGMWGGDDDVTDDWSR